MVELKQYCEDGFLVSTDKEDRSYSFGDLQASLRGDVLSLVDKNSRRVVVKDKFNNYSVEGARYSSSSSALEAVSSFISCGSNSLLPESSSLFTRCDQDVQIAVVYVASTRYQRNPLRPRGSKENPCFSVTHGYNVAEKALLDYYQNNGSPNADTLSICDLVVLDDMVDGEEVRVGRAFRWFSISSESETAKFSNSLLSVRPIGRGPGGLDPEGLDFGLRFPFVEDRPDGPNSRLFPCTRSPQQNLLTLRLVRFSSVTFSDPLPENNYSTSFYFSRLRLEIGINSGWFDSNYARCSITNNRGHSFFRTGSYPNKETTVTSVGFNNVLVYLLDKSSDNFDYYLINQDVYITRFACFESFFFRYGEGAFIVNPSYNYGFYEYDEVVGNEVKRTKAGFLPELVVKDTVVKRIRRGDYDVYFSELYFPASDVILLVNFTNKDYLKLLRDNRGPKEVLTDDKAKDVLQQAFHGFHSPHNGGVIDISYCCGVLFSTANATINTFPCNRPEVEAYNYAHNYDMRLAPDIGSVDYNIEQITDVVLPACSINYERNFIFARRQRVAFIFTAIMPSCNRLLSYKNFNLSNVPFTSPDINNPLGEATSARAYATRNSMNLDPNFHVGSLYSSLLIYILHPGLKVY